MRLTDYVFIHCYKKICAWLLWNTIFIAHINITWGYINCFIIYETFYSVKKENEERKMKEKEVEGSRESAEWKKNKEETVQKDRE